MQLSNDQVQYLFRFTQKKSVHWYDLQIELVDHLASRIEEEMDADTSLSFEAALEKVYKSFGLFGFDKIVQEKQEQIQRTARNMWWKEILDFFTWPKACLLALMVFVLWQLSLLIDPNFLMVGFIAIYVIANIVLLIYMFRHNRVRKKLLLLQLGPFHFSFVINIYQFFIIFGNDNFSAFEFCIYSTLGILFLVASFLLYFKVKKKARELYPAAF